MKIASAIYEGKDGASAGAAVLDRVRAEFGDEPVDLAVVFISRQFLADGTAEGIARDIADGSRAEHLIGCTAGAVIGGGREVEGGPAVSLMLLRLPGVEVHTALVTQDDILEAREPEDWHQSFGADPDDEPVVVLLPDPFSIDAGVLVETLNEVYPGLPLVGGLASAAQSPGENLILVDGAVHREGAALAVLSGDVQVLPVVGQGCRSVGRHLVITKAQGNVIHALGGRPALDVMRELLEGLPEDDQALARQALLLGRVINEHQHGFGRGDFLMRNIVGVDPKSGAVAVGDRVRTGQTIQFHVRDGRAAGDELRELLDEAGPRLADVPPGGALLFSCMGRGEGMYGVANHDADAIRDAVKDLPVSGFFANGEIGPVGGRNFIHGFTSSIAFLLPR